MVLANLAFGVFAVAILLSALYVVVSRNIFRMALALTACLSVVGGLFILLSADFVAAAQILIYVGGVMIVMLFVIMFSQTSEETLPSQTNDQPFNGLLVSGLIAVLVILTLIKTPFNVKIPTFEPTTTAIGRLLMGEMVVPFEVISLVLLSALIGAVFFGQKAQGKSK